MRIASHHKSLGDRVELVRGRRFRTLGFNPDIVYGSAIFERSAPFIADLIREYPDAIVGGTGVNIDRTLSDVGIPTTENDYSIYPEFRQSIGFTQRGCRLRCSFCVVPRKEGAVAEESTIDDIWRGEPWPKELILLDNDFFGQAHWRNRIEEIREGSFKVNFSQGINARFLTDEAAESLASVDYRNSTMSDRRLYTAWDNQKDEDRLFAGLNRLVKYGVRPSHIMVYMLIGYWPGETAEDRNDRRQKLRDFGALPYPMPFIRTRELVGFQRWVIGAYDKRVKWEDFEAAKYQPRGLRDTATQFEMFA
jgi:hypothetical protein